LKISNKMEWRPKSNAEIPVAIKMIRKNILRFTSIAMLNTIEPIIIENISMC
jgi:hypothetical protein